MSWLFDPSPGLSLNLFGDLPIGGASVTRESPQAHGSITGQASDLLSTTPQQKDAHTLVPNVGRTTSVSLFGYSPVQILYSPMQEGDSDQNKTHSHIQAGDSDEIPLSGPPTAKPNSLQNSTANQILQRFLASQGSASQQAAGPAEVAVGGEDARYEAVEEEAQDPPPASSAEEAAASAVYEAPSASLAAYIKALRLGPSKPAAARTGVSVFRYRPVDNDVASTSYLNSDASRTKQLLAVYDRTGVYFDPVTLMQFLANTSKNMSKKVSGQRINESEHKDNGVNMVMTFGKGLVRVMTDQLASMEYDPAKLTQHAALVATFRVFLEFFYDERIRAHIEAHKTGKVVDSYDSKFRAALKAELARIGTNLDDVLLFLITSFGDTRTDAIAIIGSIYVKGSVDYTALDENAKKALTLKRPRQPAPAFHEGRSGENDQE